MYKHALLRFQTILYCYYGKTKKVYCLNKMNFIKFRISNILITYSQKTSVYKNEIFRRNNYFFAPTNNSVVILQIVVLSLVFINIIFSMPELNVRFSYSTTKTLEFSFSIRKECPPIPLHERIFARIHTRITMIH